MIAIRIQTTNDRNGNPRRGWIIVDDAGGTIAFVDEGCAGIGSLERWFTDYTKMDLGACRACGWWPLSVTGAIEVTPREYRAQLRAQKERDSR